MSTICSWPCVATMDPVITAAATAARQPKSGKSFVQALSSSCELQLNQLPPKVVMGTSVRVKISQSEYENGLADCKYNLHGRITLHKGDSPLTTLGLKQKLSNLWPSLRNWNLTPLGKGFFEFTFSSIEDMRKVWALGVVNLKPGLLRFYCWTKDFKPQDLVQSHAQIWVRLMHLPQEYWRRQTLYEIASGLGTPLTIDEATQQRRFGLFARVLVDVDLSEKLFETVVVEREGHALSIDVHYEKQPLFCANCKILGHNLQNCMKLNNTNNSDGPSKLKSNVDMNGKKHMVQVLSGKKLREGDFIDHVKTADKALNNEPSLDAPSQQNVEQVHLTLHNPFELLDNGSELVTDEAETADMEPTPTRLDMQTVQNPCVEDNSLGKDSMTQNTNTEDTGIFAKRPSEPMILTSCKPLLGSANGRLSFPISGPASLVSPVLQPVLTPITTTDEPVKKGNLVSPDVSKEKVGLNQTAPSEAPCNLVNRPSQSAAFSPIKMATPITINEELGPDKGKIHVIGGSKNVTAAAKKSVQILSKLWGDVVDSDHTTDGTLDPDSDSEKMNMHPVALQFLEAHSDALHQPKSSRKSRKSSSSAICTGSDGITSSERIQTRSKKGVIKSNPKYVS